MKPKLQHLPADRPLLPRRAIGPLRHFREIRLKDADDAALGGEGRRRASFNDVQYVDVIGTSKGKGTAGVMKRHHFGGQPASHGTERKHRSPGSIASRATWRGQCGKPKKGVRMAGHMGMDQVTTRNHPLVKDRSENNLLLIKGALPGPNGGLLFVRQSYHGQDQLKAGTATAMRGCMIEVPVLQSDRREGRDASRSTKPSSAARFARHLLKQALVMYHANQRQGTVQTLARGEVAGSTRKIFRQKGTGNARTGGIRNPIKKGGGHAKQKRPKDWRQAIRRRPAGWPATARS